MAFRFLTIFLLFFAAELSVAKDMVPEEIYARCHARLSDFPVDIDSANYKKVKAGKLNPITACQQLLARANFKKDGNQFILQNDKDPIAIGILRNLHAFHISWFPNIAASHRGPDQLMYNYRDLTEPALFITDALFTRRHYQTVFTRKSGLNGVRRSPKSDGYYMYSSRNFDDFVPFAGPMIPGKPKEYTEKNIDRLKFKRVSAGYLVGVEPPRSMNFDLPISLYRDPVPANALRTALDDVKSHNLAQNFGGGVLGSPSNIMMNKEFVALADGGTKVYRRMANSTFYDLMCLTLPNLKDSDTNAYLNKYKGSGLAFRTDKSCAACHATLDPFAHSLRNVQVVDSAPGAFRNNLRAVVPGALEIGFPKQYKVRFNAQSTDDEDDVYHRRRPDGQLYYRNYNGQLVDKTVRGPAQLGAEIAKQDDIYMCATQRYYKFLTGIEVAVATPSSSPFYKEHRKEVVKLGKAFKTHGSLQKLIVDIMKTDAFQTRNPGLEVTESE